MFGSISSNSETHISLNFRFFPIPNGTLVYLPIDVFEKLKSSLLNQNQFQIFIGLDSIAIHHDSEISEATLEHFLNEILMSDMAIEHTKTKDFIPIFYDLDSLDWLAIEAKMQRTRDEVIKIHLESRHIIEMYGFFLPATLI
ncbi:MAG: carboxyltransferase domain-containing protein [Saprospiraceae bacterium]|nr:carboxyltransferase domain-containing protein [Saprospiraceae bacterium]